MPPCRVVVWGEEMRRSNRRGFIACFKKACTADQGHLKSAVQ
jgi:hypothetical protein